MAARDCLRYAIECCLTYSIEIFYADEGLSPLPAGDTPPGTLGYPPSEFDPYQLCLTSLAEVAYAPRWKELRGELKAIRVLLALTSLVGVVSVVLRWCRSGRQSLWLVRRMTGPKGVYFIPNPATAFLLPILVFSACGQWAVSRANIATESGNSDLLLIAFVLCIDSLWIAGWVQGIALLFSISRFLTGRTVSSHSIWMAPGSGRLTISIQRAPAWLINGVAILAPAVLLVLSITFGVLSCRSESYDDPKFWVQVVSVGLQDLSAAYTVSNGTELPGCEPGGQVSQLDSIVMDNLMHWAQRPTISTFVVVLFFDFLFAALYIPLASTVVSVIHKQLRLISQTAKELRQPYAVHVGKHQALPPEADEIRATRGRLRTAYASIVILGNALLAVTAVDTVFVSWGALSEDPNIFHWIAPISLWTWTLTALLSVCVLAVQALSTHPPPLPVRNLADLTAPADPSKDFYYGQGDDEEAVSEGSHRPVIPKLAVPLSAVSSSSLGSPGPLSSAQGSASESRSFVLPLLGFRVEGKTRAS